MTRGCLPLVLVAALALPCAGGVDLDGNDCVAAGSYSWLQGAASAGSFFVVFYPRAQAVGPVVTVSYNNVSGVYYGLVLQADGTAGCYNWAVWAYSGNTYTVGWNTAVAAMDSRYAYVQLNGGTRVQSAANSSGSWSGNYIHVGHNVNPASFLNGIVAEVWFWRGIQLTEAEGLALHKGQDPRTVRPGTAIRAGYDSGGFVTGDGWRNVFASTAPKLATLVSDPATSAVAPRGKPLSSSQQSYYLDLRHPDLFDEEVFRAA